MKWADWPFKSAKLKFSTKKRFAYPSFFPVQNKLGEKDKIWQNLTTVTKLLSGALDSGVDGEGEDEEDEAVEDAQDRQTAVLWVVLWAWKYQIWIYSSLSHQYKYKY